MTEPVRILLIDDHTLLRESLVRCLVEEPTLQVVAHCATLTEARSILADTLLDLILLDYDLGDHPGTDLLQFLLDRRSAARVLMLTAGMTPGAMRLALDGGAAGVILKQTGSAQLLEAIHRVARGETLWSAASIDDMRTTTGVQRVAHQNARNLTDRQRLVLRGILDGLANKEIAANLDASETSIKASIQELFAKGGVRTRSQLVRVALERFSATWLRDQP